MPIYEFRCNHCGVRFEDLVPMGDGGEALVCPLCGETGVRRLLSAFAAGGLSRGGGGGGCAPGG